MINKLRPLSFPINQGLTPLMYACSDGNEALVKTLIEYHALLDTQVKPNYFTILL